MTELYVYKIKNKYKNQLFFIEFKCSNFFKYPTG